MTSFGFGRKLVIVFFNELMFHVLKVIETLKPFFWLIEQICLAFNTYFSTFHSTLNYNYSDYRLKEFIDTDSLLY